MIAALLHLEKGAGAALEAVDEMRARSPSSGMPTDGWRAAREVALRLELGPIAEDEVDLGHRGIALRGDLGGAAGDDDRRARDARGGRGGSPGAPGARPRR